MNCLNAVLAYSTEEIQQAPPFMHVYLTFSKRACGSPLIEGETICEKCKHMKETMRAEIDGFIKSRRALLEAK